MPFLEGVLFGLATMLLIGPVFFTLLKASLDHGVRGGVTVAVGIIASDMLIALICLTSLVHLVQRWIEGPWMALVAAVVLVVLGISYLLKPSSGKGEQGRPSTRNAMALLSSGFLVNFVNPFVFVIWIGFALRAEQAHGEGPGTYFFLAGVLSGIFSTDVIKALLAPRLRKVLTPASLRRLYLAIGVIMLLFSVRLFIHAVQHWPGS